MSIPEYERSFASHHRAKFWSDTNGDIQPEDVFLNSNKKFWFKCGECGHDFESALSDVTYNGQWCPYCANQNLCDNEECKICENRSFASHPKAEFWSKKNDVSPRRVFKSSGNKFIFDCDKCSHEFESQLNSIVKGSWCSFCANKQLCHNNCDLCYNKSFACHPRADFWSDKNNVSPRRVFKSSHTKFWFNCVCGHEFKRRLCDITSGFWCPFCSNRDLCEEEKCKICYEKSFASSNRAKHWSPKNILQPRRVFLNCNSKFWFICENKHGFESSLGNITNRNQWCPMCKNKTEKKLYDWLLDEYKEVGFQPKFAWCKNNKKKCLPFDFQLEKFKILIEVDGDQHFRQISNWQTPEVTQVNDKFKMDKATENGYTLIRIYQPDVFADTINWQQLFVKFAKITDIF